MALDVQIYARNMEVTDRIHDYVTKKVSKLGRFLSDVEEARVDLTLEKSARSAADRQVAQITIRGKGYILRSEERSDDIFAALDSALDKMQRRMKRYKDKRQQSRQEGPSKEKLLEQPVEDVDEETSPIIARRKHFMLTPMDEMEALEQMALLGHEEFFVFFNANTNAINVLYRRRNGTYGLIEPEIG